MVRNNKSTKVVFSTKQLTVVGCHSKKTTNSLRKEVKHTQTKPISVITPFNLQNYSGHAVKHENEGRRRAEMNGKLIDNLINNYFDNSFSHFSNKNAKHLTFHWFKREDLLLFFLT